MACFCVRFTHWSPRSKEHAALKAAHVSPIGHRARLLSSVSVFLSHFSNKLPALVKLAILLFLQTETEKNLLLSALLKSDNMNLIRSQSKGCRHRWKPFSSSHKCLVEGRQELRVNPGPSPGRKDTLPLMQAEGKKHSGRGVRNNS